MKNRNWIHIALLSAMIIYVCLFAIESSKFLGGIGKKDLSASLISTVNFQEEKKTVIVPGVATNNFEIFWNQDGEKYISGKNIFKAVAEGLKTRIELISDTSDGKKVGDWVSWIPQVFLNEKEILVTSQYPILTSVDSANETLEWDYGICKRKIQLKANSLIESYVFGQDPKGIVKIKSNIEGNLQADTYYAIDGNKKSVEGFTINRNEKVLSLSATTDAIYPITIGDNYLIE